MSERITVQQFRESDGVEDWRVLSEGACAYFRTGSFAAGGRLVEAISRLEGLDAQHAAIDMRPDAVTVRLLTVTDDYWGMSDRDVAMARQISAIARAQGLVAAVPGPDVPRDPGRTRHRRRDAVLASRPRLRASQR